MGYRSEVKCIIYGRPEYLDALIAKHTLQDNPFLSDLKEYISFGMMDRTLWLPNGNKEEVRCKVLDFYGDSFKWYDEFEDVQGLYKIMDDIDQNWDNKIDFEFVRVGEEHKDIETKSSVGAYGFIYPTTTIVIDTDIKDLPNE